MSMPKAHELSAVSIGGCDHLSGVGVLSQYHYKYRNAAVGQIAELYDELGQKLGEAVGFGKRDARLQAKIAAGLVDPAPSLKNASAKASDRKKKHRTHEPKGSIMVGLVGQTGIRDWKRTK